MAPEPGALQNLLHPVGTQALRPPSTSRLPISKLPATRNQPPTTTSPHLPFPISHILKNSRFPLSAFSNPPNPQSSIPNSSHIQKNPRPNGAKYLSPAHACMGWVFQRKRRKPCKGDIPFFFRPYRAHSFFISYPGLHPGLISFRPFRPPSTSRLPLSQIPNPQSTIRISLILILILIAALPRLSAERCIPRHVWRDTSDDTLPPPYTARPDPPGSRSAVKTSSPRSTSRSPFVPPTPAPAS